MLGIVERLLCQGNPELSGIVRDSPTNTRPRLVGTGAAWRIVYVTPRASAGELAAAAAGLAELVGGRRRVKRCATCGRPFCDRTSGCTRKWCAEHRRASSAVD